MLNQFLSAVTVFGVVSSYGVSGAEPIRQVLTSAVRGIHLEQWSINQDTLPLPHSRSWSVTKTTLHGGRQEGVDLIVVNNGRLKFTVIPTRGMGVLNVESGEVRLGWESPVKGVVHPAYVNLQSRGGLGCLEGFNE